MFTKQDDFSWSRNGKLHHYKSLSNLQFLSNQRIRLLDQSSKSRDRSKEIAFLSIQSQTTNKKQQVLNPLNQRFIKVMEIRHFFSLFSFSFFFCFVSIDRIGSLVCLFDLISCFQISFVWSC